MKRLEPHVERRMMELQDRYALTSPAYHALTALLLHQAADEHASTTVREPGEAVDRHVADSLVALDLPGFRAASTVADLGSGPGWPGLAIGAALHDHAHVTLVESATRRCRYLEGAVAVTQLDTIEVVHARAEEWRPPTPQDVVTARALAPLNVLCEYAAPLLREGGMLVAWKGRPAEAELAAGARAAEALGMAEPYVEPVQPYAGAGPATLVVVRKIAPTPERFPRRPGMALKRPLGEA